MCKQITHQNCKPHFDRLRNSSIIMAALSNTHVINELHCLVCDDTIESNFVNKSENKNGIICQKFCLLASRYLNFRCNRYSPTKTITSNFRQVCENESNELNKRFLCEKCLLLADEFCSICDQWNYLDMLYNWRLKTTAELINKKIKKVYFNDRDKIKNSVSNDDGMDDFRVKFSTQVDNKVLTEWPRLRLYKHKTEKLTRETGISEESSNSFSSENLNEIPEEIAVDNENGEPADITKIICNQETSPVSCFNKQAVPEPTLANPVTQTFDVNQEKPYECKVCAKRFIRLDNCIFHEKITHKKAVANNISVHCDSQFGPLRMASVNKNVADETETSEEISESQNPNHEESLHLNENQNSESCQDDGHLKRNLYQDSTNWQHRHGRFRCCFCNRGFLKKYHCIRHQRTHTGERPYKCDVCGKAFIQLYNLKIHQKRKHNQCDVTTAEKNFRCKSKTKLNPNHLDSKTITAVHETTPVCLQPVEISSINQPVTEPATVSAAHEPDTDQNKIIPMIAEPTPSSSKITTAENVGSESQEEIQCEVCSKRFSNLKKLKSHMRYHGDKAHKCKICTKSYVVRSKLILHERTHTNEKPFSCQYCGRRFSLKQNCTVHEETHIPNSERSQECHICGKPLFSKSSYIHHQKRMHKMSNVTPVTVEVGISKQSEKIAANKPIEPKNSQREIEYEVCNKRLINRQKALKYHGHRAHKCKICAKSFTSRDKLVRHEIIHTDERPFRCQYCDRRFGRKDHCTIHEKTHTRERSQECQICGKTLASKYSYIKHLKQVHKISNVTPVTVDVGISKQSEKIAANKTIEEMNIVKDRVNQTATSHSDFGVGNEGQIQFMGNDMDVPDIHNLEFEAGPIILSDHERDQKSNILHFFSEYILPDN